MANAERLKMASGEGNTVTETGGATVTEARTPIPKYVRDAFADTITATTQPQGIIKGFTDKLNELRGRTGPAEESEEVIEPQAGGPGRTGGGSGGGGGRGGGPEGPRGPERRSGPELEPNPERDRWLVDEIVRLRNDFTIQERYKILDSEGRPYLKVLYQELQERIDLWCKVRNEPDPFEIHKAFPKPTRRIVGGRELLIPPVFPPKPQEMLDMDKYIRDFLTQYQLEGTEETEESLPFRVENLPETSIADRITQYKDSSSSEEFQAARADLLIFFRQAKNRGLLQEVDAFLNSTYQEIISASERAGERRIYPTQLLGMLGNRIEEARGHAQLEFRGKSLEDPTIPQQLSEVGDAYIDWAERKMAMVFLGQIPPEDREGEWVIPTAEDVNRDRRTTYWITTSWPKYYQVTAETEEQFLIAKETFFKMIRTAGLGKSPAAIYEHIQNFIEAFKGAGGSQVERKIISSDFLEENRLELEALLYVFVASYSKESYNQKQTKEAMMTMALDEGPARWEAVYRAGKGGVAAFTQMFDMENIMDIYNNPAGERGEIDIIAGHLLQDRIQDKVIERGIGIVLKDYDPRDEYFSSDDLGAKIAAAADLDNIKDVFEQARSVVRNNIRILKRGKRAETLLSAFEREELNVFRRRLRELGFTGGQFKDLEESQVDRIAEALLGENEREQERMNAFATNLKRLALVKNDEEFKRLYEGFDKGDYHIKNYEQYSKDLKKPEGEREYPAWKELPESIRKSIDLGRIQKQLEDIRKAVSDGQIKLEKGETAVNKLSLRDRQTYQAAYDEAKANFDIAFQMQGVLGEKARKGRGFLYVDRNEHIRYYFEVWDDFRLKRKDIDNPAQISEFTRILSEEKRESFYIGLMLAKMRDGKKFDSFSREWQDFYKNSKKDKEDIVENIPVYQAENWVNWGVFRTKMKYADDSDVWNDKRIWNNSLARQIKQKNLNAGKKELYNFKAQYRRAKVREARKSLIKEISTKGFEAQLWDDERGPDGEKRLMTFKRPKGEINQATGKWEASKDERGNVIVEDAEATFQIAALSSDFRNRYTDHTYWYYQGNNKDTILAPHIREAAERIRDGISRPEDEDPLATQLLIVDPTLCRVKKFEEVQQEREVTLVAAAVLESFQDHQRTRHALHRAFLPKDGYHGRMRTGYRNEDWAGLDRFSMGFEEFAGQQPLRFARRGAAWIANVPFEHDAAGPRWGVPGVSGAVRVMADEIKKYAHQGIVGQFGLTKIFEVWDKANVDILNHLIGYVDPQTGKWVFGLLEKPTDNNEIMHKYTTKAQAKEILANPTETIPFLYDFKDCFKRLTEVTQDMRVMDSATDNSAGAINLEEVDVFLADGSFNTDLESNKDIYLENGTARNRQNAFLYGEEDWIGFYEWLQNGSPGGGADVYSEEKYWNSFLNKTFKKLAGEEGMIEDKIIKVWMTEKII